MNLLVVEDDNRMAELLQRGFSEEGHSVMCALNGKEGLRLARSHEFHAIVLDVMLPELSGFEVAKYLRAERVTTPILMLTARDSVDDIVLGLGLGADDYLTKPFSFDELLARLQAIMRPYVPRSDTKLQFADLVLDLETRKVSRADTLISLTRTEYRLLETLMARGGDVVPKRRLIEAVWGLNPDVEENRLEAFIRLLRNKVDLPGLPKLIHTVRTVGYSLRCNVRS